MAPSTDVRQLVEHGSQLLTQGDIEAVRALWEPHKDSPEILGHLAWLERSCGRRSLALSYYLDLYERMPDNPEVSFRIGEIWRDRGDWVQAAAWFEKAGGYKPARKALKAARLWSWISKGKV